MTAHPAETGAASVLLAEHEPEVAEMSARYLRKDGLRVHLVTDPGEALAELTGGCDAAAVLDLTMPGLDPRRIRRALRTPVIFLVAGPRPRGLAQRGAAAGATGTRRWLGRPFSPRLLVAMVREVLAAAPATGAPVVTDGRRVPLTATEAALLAVMMDNPGRVLSRRQLLAAAGRQTAGDRAADVYVAQLRAKIGPDPKVGVIRTVRGAGYALDQLPGASHEGTQGAGLPSVAQQYRFEGTSETA